VLCDSVSCFHPAKKSHSSLHWASNPFLLNAIRVKNQLQRNPEMLKATTGQMDTKTRPTAQRLFLYLILYNIFLMIIEQNKNKWKNQDFYHKSSTLIFTLQVALLSVPIAIQILFMMILGCFQHLMYTFQHHSLFKVST